MEPTQLKTGPLPVHSSSTTSPEAFARTPTLMAGAIPGGQGSIRVWAPSIWRLRTLRVLTVVPVLLWSVGLLSVFTPWWRLVHPFIPFFYWITILPLHAWWTALRRPCYITTDDAGIALTTAKGACALRWEEIRTFGPGASYLSLTTATTKIEMNVSGYPPAAKKELAALITSKSSLFPKKSARQVHSLEPEEFVCWDALTPFRQHEERKRLTYEDARRQLSAARRP